ncbi:MAG: 30S ribosomal protein S6 [bacterium]
MATNSYELLFITEPALDAERLAAIQERIAGMITAGAGTVESTDDWGVRRLAYKIKKSDEGRYILINFLCDPAQIAAIDKQIRIMQDIMRFVVVRKGD